MKLKKLSPKNLAANRANSKKSTGPKSLEGKARVAANAIKHGLCARDLTALGENYTLLAETKACYYESWQPANGFEATLVDHLAYLSLRLLRFTRMETGLLDMKIPDVTEEHSRETINSALSHAFIEYEKNFNNMSRYETALSRAYDRTLKQLLSVRKERRKRAHFEKNENYETKPFGVEPKEPSPDNKADLRFSLDLPIEPADLENRRTGKHIPFPKADPPVWTLIEVDNDGNERIVT